MRKEQILHAASDYLPFVGMLLPTLLLVTAAAVSMSGSGRAADTPRAIDSALEIRIPNQSVPAPDAISIGCPSDHQASGRAA